MDSDEADYRQRLQRALGPDFELGERIGQGGFGSVYAARDLRLDSEVAVKALRQDLFPTRTVLERFQAEARAVAKLRHPNILPVYAVGEGEGIAFMIMPLIRGESLATAREREGTLPPAEGFGLRPISRAGSMRRTGSESSTATSSPTTSSSRATTATSSSATSASRRPRTPTLASRAPAWLSARRST